jgi:hypothetical protein
METAAELEEELNETLRHVRKIYDIIEDLPQQSSINFNIKLAVKHDNALTEILGITEEILDKYNRI